jgi:hypothetical protein
MEVVMYEGDIRLLWDHEKQLFYWDFGGELKPADMEGMQILKQTHIDQKTGMVRNPL